MLRASEILVMRPPPTVELQCTVNRIEENRAAHGMAWHIHHVVEE